MKIKLLFEVDNTEDAEAYVNGIKNKVKLDFIYDEIFRPVIRYSENENEVTYYSQCWEKLSRYLEE